ncbi:MAG: hypothetical protein M1587_05300 [Thaumarchaeota archaeon]|nr:hypothetical protein [Nitrososphaerota archaeon]
MIDQEENKEESLHRFMSCIDSAMDVFGDSVKHVIYWNLEKEFGVKKEQIAQKPGKLAAIIDKIFGSGGETVKMTIIKGIAQSTGSPMDEDLDAALKIAYKYFMKI